MDLQLTGKKALVTGSTAGIGLAIATRLAAEGAAVVVNGRTHHRVDEAIESIKSNQREANITGVAADVGTADGCHRLVEAVPEVDILVNNVGIFRVVPFEDIDDPEWITIYETNVVSGVRLSRAYLPKMREAGWGRIIFISSESGVQIPEEMIHYGVTKAAQLALARGLAEANKGTGVTINSVLPGPTHTEGVEKFLQDFAEEKDLAGEDIGKAFVKEGRPTSLIQRLADPEEVAAVVAFVASPLASAVNGAPVRVDGGVIRAMT
jgi:NAD(P)-dependent dehydrogenase (short-subunit alcohol dehydrogenase family)